MSSTRSRLALGVTLSALLLSPGAVRADSKPPPATKVIQASPAAPQPSAAAAAAAAPAAVRVAAPPPASAAEPDSAAAAATPRAGDAQPRRGFFDSFQVGLALLGAAPVLFTDVADARLEKTTAFQFGGRLAAFAGTELKDLHRFGLGLGYSVVARSPSRSLNYLTPTLLYEIGHPLVLQLALGWNVGLGTAGFASNYSGLHTAIALRYSFRQAQRASPVGVSAALTGGTVLSSTSLQYSTAFVGAQLELTYHPN